MLCSIVIVLFIGFMVEEDLFGEKLSRSQFRKDNLSAGSEKFALFIEHERRPSFGRSKNVQQE